MPNVKPILPPLKTPKTATFPLELQDSPSSIFDSIKKEESSTPPYTTIFYRASQGIHGFYKRLGLPVSAGASFHKFSEKISSQPGSAVDSSNEMSPSTKSPCFPLPPRTPKSAGPLSKGPLYPNYLLFRHSKKNSPTTADPPRSATSVQSPHSTSDWTVSYSERIHTSSCRSGKQAVEVVSRTVTLKGKRIEPTMLAEPPKYKRRKFREDKANKHMKDIKEVKEIKHTEEIQEAEEIKVTEDIEGAEAKESKHTKDVTKTMETKASKEITPKIAQEV
ncbi:hypothetical protein N7454_008662 [Penicillium verhagenii]|nr:hypothetical protein N7454_008662 [Penicillium verhagenii]